MSLPRKVTNPITYERTEYDVWDISTKTIIFTGTSNEIGIKFNTHRQNVRDAARQKFRLLKKYAIRIKSSKDEN